ncbi:hypothetical protein CY34DRAFT_812004 [Suillus luteus UH-Slu-Lm8-n1]|uniref:Uncharacterized protein n=1 Tax=Suillus luteus UH-Slu-Lm8-n1 TaxID=930992 RepID=A0A0D0AN21_9AGAM|nr:hypothetical protein CY34DRAFT_812004 [Suillus luteus UH-Slu-Lm8-n1]
MSHSSSAGLFDTNHRLLSRIYPVNGRMLDPRGYRISGYKSKVSSDYRVLLASCQNIGLGAVSRLRQSRQLED